MSKKRIPHVAGFKQVKLQDHWDKKLKPAKKPTKASSVTGKDFLKEPPSFQEKLLEAGRKMDSEKKETKHVPKFSSLAKKDVNYAKKIFEKKFGEGGEMDLTANEVLDLCGSESDSDSDSQIESSDDEQLLFDNLLRSKEEHKETEEIKQAIDKIIIPDYPQQIKKTELGLTNEEAITRATATRFVNFKISSNAFNIIKQYATALSDEELGCDLSCKCKLCIHTNVRCNNCDRLLAQYPVDPMCIFWPAKTIYARSNMCFFCTYKQDMLGMGQVVDRIKRKISIRKQSELAKWREESDDIHIKYLVY